MRIYHFPWLAAVSLVLTSCGATNGTKRPRLRETVSYGEFSGEKLEEGKRSTTGTLKKSPSGFEVTGADGSHFLVRAARLGDRSDFVPDPGKEYRIDILTRIVSRPKAYTYIYDELAKVSDGERVIYDASLCPVHRVTMMRKPEGRATKDDYPRSFYRQREEKFPNDGISYLGCVEGGSDLRWSCPECYRLSERRAKELGIKE